QGSVGLVRRRNHSGSRACVRCGCTCAHCRTSARALALSHLPRCARSRRDGLSPEAAMDRRMDRFPRYPPFRRQGHMPEDVRVKLEQIIDRLKPSDLLNQARAVVLNRMPGGGGWDFADGEDDEGDASEAWKKADKMAQEVGRWLASDAAIRAEFLAELLAQPHPMRAFECGRGLAEG